MVGLGFPKYNLGGESSGCLVWKVVFTATQINTGKWVDHVTVTWLDLWRFFFLIV